MFRRHPEEAPPGAERLVEVLRRRAEALPPEEPPPEDAAGS